MNFDENQRQAIECDKNCVVTAGAGSGKTTVLAARFLNLVTACHYKIDEILTLTFTKKAATEMASRIYQKLSQSEDAEAKAATKDFFKAQIKTLDSYFSYLARLGCTQYGISQDFSIDENVIKSAVSQLSCNFVMQNKDNDSLKCLIGTQDYCAVGAKIFSDIILKNSTIVNPIDFDACLNAQSDFMVTEWKDLSNKVDKYIGDIQKLFSNGECKKTGKIYAQLHLILDGLNNTPTASDFSKSFSKDGVLDTHDLFEYVQFVKKVSSIALNREKTPINDVVKSLRVVAITLVSFANWVSVYPTMLGVSKLLDEFQKIVNDYKRRTARLFYSDVSDMALDILINNPDIRAAEKKKYRAIMIDEFQDNNKKQRDILFLLAEKLGRLDKSVPKALDITPNKLFFVGDEKQSIYKFRGADVSVFKDLSKDFPNGHLLLDTNYRSKKSLIVAFNEIFGGKRAVFYTKNNENLATSFDAIYTDAKVPKKNNEDSKNISKDINGENDFATRVHFALCNTPGKDDETVSDEFNGEQEEANWVAKKILSLFDRGVKPGDIAILLRKYKLQSLYERTLLQNGIPYNSTVVTGLFGDGVVNDFYSILTLVVKPCDSLCLMQYLTGPFVAMDSVIAAKIVKMNKDERGTPKAAFSGITPYDDFTLYQKAKMFYNFLVDYVKEHTICEVLTFLWYEAALRYGTLWNTRVSLYKKLYDLLFEAALRAQNNGVSLGAFVDGLSIYRVKRLEDMDIPLPTLDGVNILTIHKSKGLEWPVVFVSGTHEGPYSNNNKDAAFFDKKYGLSVNVDPDYATFGRDRKYRKNYLFEQNKAIDDDASEAELRRFSYVALTRARDDVFITCGKYKKNENASVAFAVDRDKNSDESKTVDTIFKTFEPFLNDFIDKENESKQLDPASSNNSVNPVNSTKPADLIDIEYIGTQENINNIKLTTKAATILRMQQYYSEERVQKVDDSIDTWAYLYPSKMDILGVASLEDTKDTGDNIESNNSYKNFAQVTKKSFYAKTSDNNRGRHTAAFGVLTHRAIQCAIDDKKFSPTNSEYLSLADNDIDRQKKLQNCMDVVKRFMASVIFTDVKKSTYYKTEFSFVSRKGYNIIKGTIDLLYKNSDGTYSIIDYKTDENIDPARHKTQLSVYREMVAKLFNTPESNVLCKLYYTKYDKFIDI